MHLADDPMAASKYNDDIRESGHDERDEVWRVYPAYPLIAEA